MTGLTRRVLVLGEGTRAFLTVVRSLGRAGLEVHVAWCAHNEPALRSKYVKRFHPLPRYRAGDDSCMAAFDALLREQQFDLVIPCTDGTALPLQLHRAELSFPERICLLPDDVYRVCANKDETYCLAQRLGIALPAQAVASTIDDVRAAASAFGYPLLLKPRSSSAAPNPLKRRAVRKISWPKDLDAAAEAMLADDAILVQQNFQGIGAGVEVLAKDGRILAAFQHERVHEPMRGGGSSYRKSVPLDPGMLQATRQLMEALCYTGVAMVEFRFNPATGAWVLIEINARFWGSLPLTVAAGMDFPLYLYQLWCEGRELFPQEYRVNRYCRNLSLDLQWTLSNLRAKPGSGGQSPTPLPRVAAEWANVLIGRERSDTFVWDDLGPAWTDLGQYLDTKFFAIDKRLGLSRGVRRRKAVAAVRHARSVAFVCYGNICRSPFAAGVVQQLRPDLAVSSFGCHPKSARRSPEEAVAAARSLGVDLAGHRSRAMTQGDVDRADAILIFDRRNHDDLLALFSNLEGKMHYFGALDTEGPLEIADPYSSPVEEFVRCYKRLRRIAEKSFQGMVE